MNSPNSFKQERISALADGEVLGENFADAMADLAIDVQSAQSLHIYYVMGDVMRSDGLAPATHELAFLERLEAKLALEPEQIRKPVLMATPSLPTQISANDASVRWKWFAGVSFSALIALVVASEWLLQVGGTSQLVKNENPLLVMTSVAQVAAAEDQTVMVRNPQLDALMAAHQQLGGHSAFQMPSGFLRNATFERSQR
jgi:sigma-E factor negative regulatory protein RseA